MTKLVVMYPKPKDPAHFDRYFRETHIPLVKKMPGLRGSSFGPATGPDGKDGAFFWVFVGDFASAQALNDALASSEGQVVVADISNYAPDYPPTILVLDSTDS
jgi:uncharacterized protein (TIGR02118 family)